MRRWVSIVVLAMVSCMASLPSLHAAISYSGAVSPFPANWSSSNDVYVGIRAIGTVTVDSGSSVISKNAHVGYFGYGTGTVTIDGTNSKWTNDKDLYIGHYYSTGILDITGGGTVTVGGVAKVGCGYWEGNGTINFNDGTLTTQSLYASPMQLTGTGTIHTRGLVSDVDVVFDSTHGLSQSVAGFGNVTVNLDMSDPNNVGDLGAGWMGNGSLMIREGRAVFSKYGYLGYYAGSVGMATVDGIGSTWTIDNDLSGLSSLKVAESGTGTLNITNGGVVTSNSGTIASSSGSVGTVTVSGIGSQWNSNAITIAHTGSGTLHIDSGGVVSNTTGYIGVNNGSTGLVTVDGAGSAWNNSANLYIAERSDSMLKITDGGVVSDRTCYIGFAANAPVTGAVTVDGVGSTWIHSDGVRVGYDDLCTGILNITGGGVVRTFNGSIGYNAGSTGTVTISGAGSLWTNSTANVYVGLYGNGTLNIVAGGAFVNHEHGMGSIIASSCGSIGVANVDGIGSTWTEDDIIVVGSHGNGTLNVTNGGTVMSDRLWIGSSNVGTLRIANGGIVQNNTTYFGLQTGAMGMAMVDGMGSSWNNSGALTIGYVGPDRTGSGTLDIRSGGAVTATSVSLNNQSMLTIDVGSGSSLSTDDGTIASDSTIRILAGAGAAATTYTPISATTWTNDGLCQAIGGTWDTDSRQFMVSDAIDGLSGTEIEGIDLAATQRVLVSDDKGWSVGASFLASSSIIDFTATAMGDATLTSLQSLLATDDSVLSSWDFSVDNCTVSSTNPVYLSFKVGLGYSVDDLKLWHYDGISWDTCTAADLTYDGTYASFTAASFSGYAVTGIAVPEPSAMILLGIGSISLFGCLWRRRREL